MSSSIDCDKLLNDFIESSEERYERFRNQFPDGVSTAEHFSVIEKIAAHATINILKEYHRQLLASLQTDRTTPS